MSRILSLLLLFLAPLLSFSQSDEIASYEKQLSQSTSDSDKVVALIELCYLHNGIDTRKALAYGEQAVKIAESTGSQYLKAEAYNILSIPLLNTGRYPEALAFCEKALTVRMARKDTAGMISSLAKIGSINLDLGKYEKSLRAQILAVKLAGETGDLAKKAVLLNNLGSSYYQTGNMKLAEDVLERAVELSGVTGDTVNMVKAFGNLALLYKASGNFQKAIDFNLKSTQFPYNQYADLVTLGLFHQNLGTIYAEIGDEEKRLEYYLKALNFYREVDDISGLASVVGNLGNIYLQRGDHEKAEAFYLEAHEYANRTGSDKRMLESSRNLASFYTKTGKYKLAGELWEKAFQLEEKVYNDEMASQIAEMETRFETEVKERELAEKEAEVANQAIVIQRRNSLLWISGLSLAIVLISSVLIFRNMRIRQKNLKEKALLQEKLAQSELENRIHGEKVRIARELHDNIGSQLTVLSSMLESHGNRQDVHSYSSNILKDLRRTVWFMNRDQVPFGELMQKFGEYIQPLDATGFQVDLDYPEDAAILQLDAVKALNLLRVMQESIQNAVKYSDCRQILVTAKLEGGKISVEVKDEGKGFDPAIQSAGHGLQNIRYRIAEVNGSLNLITAPGKGTTVKITV